MGIIKRRSSRKAGTGSARAGTNKINYERMKGIVKQMAANVVKHPEWAI